MFCYDDVKSSGFFDPSVLSKVNPNAAYLKHYENFKYLSFLSIHETDRLLKNQALKELEIAEKRMKYWKNNKFFSEKQASEDRKVVDKKWNDTK